MSTFSAFADEISPDPVEQVAVLRECGIRFLDLRGAWNTNVMDLTEPDLDRLGRILADAGVGVAAIGSPIGKSTIDKPPAYELERLKHACELAERFKSRYDPDLLVLPSRGEGDHRVPEAGLRTHGLLGGVRRARASRPRARPRERVEDLR